MAIEVFNRYEKKYIISDDIYQKLKQDFSNYMELDQYSQNGEFYTICNIYYDTDDNDIIRRSLEKPIYKEKLRLRSYGAAGLRDRIYLEVKKKFKGCVNKRRISIVHEDALRYLETKQIPETIGLVNRQILSEIDFMVQRYPSLHPALFLSYERNAMFGSENKNFRITFDTNILTRRYDLGLGYGIYGELLIPRDQWIMEVKIDQTAPLWFAKLLSKYKVFPVSCSKYGLEFENSILKKSTAIEIDYKKICI